MNPWVKMVLLLAVCVGSAALGSEWTAREYRAEIATIRADNAKAVTDEQSKLLAANMAREAYKRQGDIQHANDQETINALRNRLARGVQIHIPTCGDTMPGTAKTDANQNGSGGPFPSRVDAAFERLRKGVDELAARCDQLNIDARAVR